jgi:hypothetical protein
MYDGPTAPTRDEMQGIADAHEEAREQLNKPLPQALLNVGEMVDVVSGKLNRLEERLRPVRSPMGAVVAGRTPDPAQPVAPITETLHSYATGLRSLAERLDVLLDDVEL